MKRTATGCQNAFLAAALIAATYAVTAAQDAPPSKPGQTMPAPPPPPPPKVEEQTQLEDAFKQAMTNVVLAGTWRMTDRAGKLTEAREEEYTIISVSKGFADNWVISARMKFGDNDVTMPFPVRVVWAGDTPIITVDDFAVPGVGTYSARVMIYRGYYCGSWFGRGYSGIMSGRIVPADEHEKTKKAQPTDGGEDQKSDAGETGRR